jgi:hypothetical protein
METKNVVVAAHVLVAIGLVAFGAYRISLGRVVPGALNVVVAALVVGVGVYAGRLA